MTSKQELSTALALVKKKQRQALALDKKAYNKAYQVKGKKRNGNTRKRSVKPETAVAPVDAGLAPA